MPADDFAKLPLLGEEDMTPTAAPTFKPNKGAGHKKNDKKAETVKIVGDATPIEPPATWSGQNSYGESIPMPIPEPSTTEPEVTELNSLQNFMDAFTGIFEVMPDYANDAGRLANYASKILPVKPPITALLVGAVAGLAAYAALGRRKQ